MFFCKTSCASDLIPLIGVLVIAAGDPSLAVDPALEKRGLDGLTAVPLEKLSERSTSPLSRIALKIHPTEWKHAETEHFVYHFVNTYVGTPVSVEAEFYFRVIAKDLGEAKPADSLKCQIFLFEEPSTWSEFARHAELDPWTGGIHAAGELFLLREREVKFKGPALGHEVAHLVLHRTFGAGVPRWLHEGYAEYVSSIGYASFQRSRGYDAKPRSKGVAPEDYIPLSILASAVTYPKTDRAVKAFYAESERLVRFLRARNPAVFTAFVRDCAQGKDLASAVRTHYEFGSLDALEDAFRPHATKDTGASE